MALILLMLTENNVCSSVTLQPGLRAALESQATDSASRSGTSSAANLERIRQRLVIREIISSATTYSMDESKLRREAAKAVFQTVWHYIYLCT